MTEERIGVENEKTATFEEAIEAGFWGIKIDTRPNEDYTVAGAIARKDELFEEGVSGEPKTAF